MRNRPALQVLALTAIGTIVGIVVVLNVPWLPERASKQAGEIDDLYNALAVVSCFVFSLVTSILVVSIINFRQRHGEEREGPPIHGSTKLEIVWTTIPTLIVAAIVIVSALVLADTERSSAESRVVKVTAQQFAWSFDYPSEGVKGAGELHLIKDQEYVFRLNSKDVIHSFWVPEFRVKKDVVPGITTSAKVEPTVIGTYPLVCTELCGLGHATMRAGVVVESKASFDRWVAQERGRR